MSTNPTDLPYDEKIADLQSRLDAARNEIVSLEAELVWWQRGRELYGNGRSASGSKITELVPEDIVLRSVPKPTLAQAIIRIIKSAEPGKDGWTAGEVMAALRERDWMPNGTSAEHVVRARLAKLAREPDGGLRRIAHGVYGLSESPMADIVPAEGR